jgi:hypothetical protein
MSAPRRFKWASELESRPVLFIIWHRTGPGHRWVKAGRTETHTEALTLIGGPGDWWISPLYDKRLADEGETVGTPFPDHSSCSDEE